MNRRAFLRRLFYLIAGALAVPAAPHFAMAQAYPTRPITMIVPFAAGGGTDVSARVISEHMSRKLCQRLVVKNIVGAGVATGSIRTMRAAPDGYTIEMGQMGTHATADKPDIDFAPIGLVDWDTVLIVARKDFPANDVNEFISYLKENAQKLNMAHAGIGAISFTCGLLLNSMVGIRPTLVPFNGVSPALNALVGGQVDYMCDGGLSQSLAFVQAGVIKAYMVGAEQRSSVPPNVPTYQEAGLRNVQVVAWLGLFAPKETPKRVLDKLAIHSTRPLMTLRRANG